MRRVPLLVLAIAVAVAACGDPSAVGPALGTGPTTTLTPPPSVSAVEPAGELLGLTATLVADGFGRPADARSPIGDNRIFVVEQTGTIHIIAGGVVLPEPFLDITDDISFDGAERGLVTIAFHPRFHENGRFYVFFTDPRGDARLVEYRVSSDDPNKADPASGSLIIEVDQPHQWHQSGSIAFGPEGYLWMSLGDGGDVGDPGNNGQNPETLLATIVRLDIETSPYAIPPDNPYVGVETDERREVWAYGVRNPWRITIDHETGLLYIPDVGQDTLEEVDVVPVDSGGGYNFGWSIMEGTSCFHLPGEGPETTAAITCDTTGITMPLFEYGRPGACAIVGGPVYRGAMIPELHGTYFFGDYCGGWIRSFRTDGSTVTDQRDWLAQIGRLGNITSLGTDGTGEILVTNLQGELWRIDPIRRDESDQ